MSDTSSVSSTPTGMTGAGGGNMIRITGMNSGLDVDSIVKKMLAGDQTKIDQAKQQQQIIQWKQQAYQSIVSDVKSLQSTYFDITNPSNCLLLQSNFNSLTASSSNTSVASATATTTAAAGNYTLQVDKVATAANLPGTQSLNSQFQVTDITKWQGRSISLSVGGPAQNINLPAAGTVTDMVNSINNQISTNSTLSGKVTASYIKDASGKEYVELTPLTSTGVQITATTLLNNDIPAGSWNKNLTSASLNTPLTSLNAASSQNMTLTLNYNGSSIPVNLDNSPSGKNGAATIGDLVTAISTATNGQVIGKFDDMTGNFSLQTTSTGSTTSLSITGETDNGGAGNALLSALNLAVSAQPATGSDAQVEITPPGATTATTLTESSNNFTVNGISYNVTGTSAAAGGPTTISVASNTQKVHDMIKGFIDKYNSIVQEIQTKLTEKKDYNYPPLTDAQKSQMSATDITNWNNKAQQGVLANDDNLQNLLTNLRQAFTTPLTDANNNRLTSLNFGNYGTGAIGLDTSSDPTQGGVISIVDDQKFTNAIAQNPQQFMQLFTNVSNVTTTSTDPNSTYFKGSGIAQRINTILQNNVGFVGTTLNTAILTKYANLQDDYSISGGAGSGTLSDQIYTKQLLINTLTDQMNSDQTKYYNQFTQLETAMSQLSAQQSTISSMASG